MSDNNIDIVRLAENLTQAVESKLTADDLKEMNRNIYHLKKDYEELKENRENLEVPADDAFLLGIRTIITANRCFGDMIQEIENIRDVIKKIKR